MIKYLLKVLLLVTLFCITIYSAVFAYSNELFEFDLPTTYEKISYQNNYFFVDDNSTTEEDDDKNVFIVTQKNSNLKKSVWDIPKSDLDDLLSKYKNEYDVINTDRKAKLGKEKAVKITLKDSSDYLEMYILASNNYVYVIGLLTSNSKDLDCPDFVALKNSFKLKDKTTNLNGIYITVFIIIIGVSFAIYKYNSNRNYNNNTFDNFNNSNEDKNISSNDDNNDNMFNT